MRIAELTREEYFENVELVRERAMAAGVKGEAYQHYHTTKGQYNGKVSTKHRPLDNGDLYAFGKADHRQAVVEALAAGYQVEPEVLADYPDLG